MDEYPNNGDHVSLIVSLSEVHWATRISAFVLSLGYPFIFCVFHAAKFQRRQMKSAIIFFIGILLTFIFGYFPYQLLRGIFLRDLSFQWYIEPFIIILITSLLNILFYVIVLIFDLHNLFQYCFECSGKKSVSVWLNGILGHKLWAGKNTYKLLKHVMEENIVLGRAKMLLVDFIGTDIEKKIQYDPDEIDVKKEDNEKSRKSSCSIYKITVHDWSVRTYSNFLANNMVHATRSINWLIDPVDLVTQIIPAHLIEVIVSIGSIINKDCMRIIKEAKNNLDKTGTIKLSVLLGDYYSKWCPIPLLNIGKCSPLKICATKLEDCPEKFPFKSEPSHRQYDYLWYAIFAGTLDKMEKSYVGDKNSIIINKKTTLTWQKVHQKYMERERIVGSLALPHIEKFRMATCTKKRHAFLGIRPSDPNKRKERIKNGTDYLKKIILHEGNYFRCVVPHPEITESDNGLFTSFLSLKDINYSGNIICQLPSGKENYWDKVKSDDVGKMLLGWALRLLEYTSGGKGVVNGVFVSDGTENDPNCKDSYDIGFYDSLLVLSSGRGKTRDVTWRVYQETPIFEKIYFPESRSNLVVKYGELVKMIEGALM